MQKLFILSLLLLLSELVNCQEPQSAENRVIIIIRAIITRRRPVVLLGLVEEVPPQNVVVIHQVPTNINQYPPQFTAPPAQNQQYQEWVKQQQVNQGMPQQYQQQIPPQYPPQMNQNYYQQQQPIQYQQNVQAYPANPVYPQQGIPISQPYPK
ncbi:unnamed protein product [Paramecium pentaurelia]|uniref:Uncharacterized protein n=1 Tax=Paramecium pentaurelia TaxID=43138 RepID=A0A8S1VQN3_9CILI|nr:unnamed protein product [Paramecium pentaurelia]